MVLMRFASRPSRAVDDDRLALDANTMSMLVRSRNPGRLNFHAL